MGKRIRDEVMYYIKKHDFKVKFIAQKLGITSQNFANKLTRETISYKSIKKIADMLGYDIVWIKRK